MYKFVSTLLIFVCFPFISSSQVTSGSGKGKLVFEKTIIVRDVKEKGSSRQPHDENSSIIVQKHKSNTADGVGEISLDEKSFVNKIEDPSKAMASNLSPYTPPGWPFPIAITNVSTHTLANVVDASTIYSNEDVHVNFATLNNGVDPTPNGTIFLTRIFVDNVLKYEGTYSPALPNNSYVYWINRNIGTLAAGFRTFRMEIDATNVISESNESDNTYSRSKTITTALGGPTISSINPTSGPAGTTVTISGSNFGTTQGSSLVRFGTNTASVIGWGNTQITVTVPSITAGNYTVSVSNSSGTGNASTQFSVTSSSTPSISSFSPASGSVGTSVTINGSNFGATQGAGGIQFGTTSATITSWSDTQIIATVPTLSAGNYTISVMTGGGTANSSTQFTVTSTTTHPDPIPAMYKTTLSTSITSTVINGIVEKNGEIWLYGNSGVIAKAPGVASGFPISWTLMNSGIPSFENIYSLEFGSSTVGFVGTGSGKIYRTTDGGASWTLVYNNTSVTNFINHIRFDNATTGIAIGDGINASSIMAYLYTTDGGSTWTNRNTVLLGTIPLTNVYFVNAGFGYMGGYTLVGSKEVEGIFRTTTSGTNWTFYTIGNTSKDSLSWTEAISFRTTAIGVAVKSDSTVWRTANSGVTWTKVGQLPRMGFGIVYNSATSVIIVGRNGMVAQANLSTNQISFSLFDESIYMHNPNYSATYSCIFAPINQVRSFYSSINPSTQLTIPTLQSPSNNATINLENNSFTWTAISGATQYDIEIGSVISATLRGTVYSTTSNLYSVKNLASGTQYQWRVRARSTTNSSLWSATRSFATTTQQAISNVVPASFPATPKTSADYRLIIVPSNSGKTVSELFTGKAPNDYRLFRDNGNSPPSHLEELNESSTLSYQEGVWLIKKNDFSLNTTMDFPVPTSLGRVALSLRFGWNIIGNPFSTPVKWSDVLNANGITPSVSAVAYSFQGANGFVPVDVLQPFTGYYYFNTAGTFYVPYPFSQSPEATFQEPAFTLNLKYSSSVNTDNSMVLGIDPGASDNFDNFEKRKPPIFSDQGSLYFNKPNWDSDHPRFASDIRPSLGDGQTWDFILNHPNTEPAQLSLTGIENLSSDYKVVLLNKQNGVIKHLDAKNSFSITSFQKDAQYSIIIGKTNYIKTKTEGFIPEKFVLHQNFPNPFNPATAIRFGLSSDAFVQLTIYDLLGKEVASLIRRELPSGVHEYAFNAKNFASGTYIYSLKAISPNDGKLIFSSTKKMILIK